VVKKSKKPKSAKRKSNFAYAKWLGKQLERDGLSLSGIASALGITRSTVYKIVKGKRRVKRA
jgi:predicted transcriptional regulator